MQMRFRRELHALPAVFSLSEEFCARNTLTESDKNVLDFVLEELFTNIVKYGRQQPDDVLIAVDREGDQLVVSVTDFDADRFDIREAAEPDVTLPVEKRTPGGLGIHLIRKMVDRIDYHYENRTSRITIYKKLG